jgi:hypothetical protein
MVVPVAIHRFLSNLVIFRSSHCTVSSHRKRSHIEAEAFQDNGFPEVPSCNHISSKRAKLRSIRSSSKDFLSLFHSKLGSPLIFY